MTKVKTSEAKQKEQAFSTINAKAFLSVVIILVSILILSGVLSYIVPQGAYQRDKNGTIVLDTYVQQGVSGIPLWKVFTAPVRIFASSDAADIIAISAFLLIMSGVFNLMDKTDGIKTFIMQVINRLRGKNGAVVCITVLIFMMFGSLLGMFEELVTLLPLIIVFMLTMGMDSMMGLGVCMMAACFGFSSAITNPFSVGIIAVEHFKMPVSSGIWLRLVFFALVYASVCVFLLMHLRKIKKNPEASLTYVQDVARREKMDVLDASAVKNKDKLFRIYSGFFIIQGVVLALIASVRAISALAIPVLAASFLIFGLGAGFLVSKRSGQVLRWFLQGAAAMLPAVAMIAIASSVKLVMEEGGIIDTFLHGALQILEGRSKFVAILLLYALVLILQMFIGSATAKLALVMPIIMPIAQALGISPTLVILTYCMADGFTDVIIPTNPVLLIGLSMANVSYGKWVKWTWKLQLFVFAMSVLILLFGVVIGY